MVITKDFLSGIEFGCLAGAFWYILFITFALIVHYKTRSVYYALGVLSMGGIGFWFLGDFVKKFVLVGD